MPQTAITTHHYPYLPDGRIIRYVPVSDPFMREAEHIRNTLSTDLNHATGAVVVLNGSVIGRGANQSALKNRRLLEMHKNGLCVRRILKVPSGHGYWLCPGCSSFRHHAETRAVKDALSRTAPHGTIVGADLYLYGHWWCCKPCWDIMISAGIRDVYLVNTADNLFKK